MADGRIEYDVIINSENVHRDLNQVNSDIEETVTSSENKANDGLKKVGNAVGNMAKQAAIATGAAIAGASVAAVKFGSEFETAIAGASTLFGDTAVDVDNLKSKMLELSSESGVAAVDLGNSLYNALSAGVPASEDMSEALEFLEKNTRLAKAGFTDIDTAQSATIKTLNAYNLGIEETDRIQKVLMQTQNLGITTVDELGKVLYNVTPTAAALGVNFEQVGAGLAVMTAAGTPAAQATTMLNSMFAELAKDGTKASKALEAAAENTQYAGMNFTEMIESGADISDVLTLIKNSADTSGLSLIDMFSSIEAGKGALALTGENAEKFKNSLKEMSTETDVVSEAFDKVSSTTAQKFEKMMNNLKNVSIKLFEKMLPLIDKIFPQLEKLIDKLIDPLMTLVDKVFESLIVVLDKLIDPFMELIDAILEPLLSVIDVLIPIFVSFVDIIARLAPILTPIVELFAMLISTILPPFIDYFAKVIDLIMPVLISLFEALQPVLERLITAIMPVFIALFEALIPIIMIITDSILPIFIEIWSEMGELFVDAIEILLPWLVEGLESLAYKLNAVAPYIKKLSDMFLSVMKPAFESMGESVEFLKGIFDKLRVFLWEDFRDGFIKTFETIKDGVKNALVAIPIFLINTINSAIEMLNGMIDKVNSIAGALNIELIPNLGYVSMPTFHTGGIVDFGKAEGTAILKSGEMVLTASQQHNLFEIANGRGYNNDGGNTNNNVTNVYMTNNVRDDLDIEKINQELKKLSNKNLRSMGM